MAFNYSKWKETNNGNSGSASSTSAVKPITGGFDYSAYKAKNTVVDVPKEEPAKLYYENAKKNVSVTQADMDNWSDKNYKMTSDDKAKFKQLKKTISNKELRSMSDTDFQKYISADNNSRSAGIAFGSGLTKGMIPFLDTIEKKSAGKDKLLDDALDTVNASENQHKVASGVGKFAGTALDYNVIGKAKGIEKLSSGIGAKLGGSKLAKAVGRIGADTLVDVGLDTIPELVGNVADGKSGGEIALDALKNVGINAGFNIGGEAIGALIGKAIDKKTAKNVAESVENVAENTKNAVENVENATKKADKVNPVVDAIKKRTENYVDAGTVREADLGKDVNLNAYTRAKKLAQRDYSEDVVEAFKDNPQIYDVLHNATTKADALDIVAGSANDAELYAAYKELLKSYDPRAVVVGDVLSKRYFDGGDYEHGLEVLEDLASQLTKGGQFTQAAAITMTKNNPLASMRFMQKNIDKINEAGRAKFKNWVDFELTDAEKKAFGEIKPGDKEALENLYRQITDRIGEQYPSTMWDKIVTTMKTSMMMHTRTHIRNVAANAAMLPVRSLSDRVSALGQNAYRLFDKNFEVNQSVLGGTREQKKIAGTIFNEQIKPLLEANNKWEDVAANVKNVRTYGDSAVGTTLKDGIIKVSNKINTLTNGKMQKLVDSLDKNMTGSALENLKRLDYWLLGAVEDDPFVKKNFTNRLASYMKAQGINAVEDVPNEAVQIAYQEALKATFKDDNYLTKAFMNVKKSTGKFGEVLLPFTKTPANIAKRGIEYSPVGFIETIKNARGKEAKELIDDLAKSTVGTAGIALGYLLAKNGLIQGALSTNAKEKQFEEMQGKKAFSIKVGDGYITYDWAQPAAIPLIIGSTIFDAIQESDDEINKLDLMKQAGVASFDAWADLSPLQSLKEIMGGNSYNSSMGENIINAVAEFPQRLYPQAANATAKTMDTTVRDTYVKGDPAQSYKNSMQAKVPGLSKELPAKRDAWGREVKRQDNTAQAFFANFLNPGQFGYNASTPIDAEIQKINAFPNVASRYISMDGKNVDLTNEQHSEYQRIMGEHSYDMATAFINSDVYNKLDDESKKNALSNMYSVAKSIAENEVIGKPIADVNKKYVDVYNTYGANGLVYYYDIKENANVDGVGGITQDDLQTYLDSLDVSKEYKDYYWNLMFTKNGKAPKKQPYR